MCGAGVGSKIIVMVTLQLFPQNDKLRSYNLFNYFNLSINILETKCDENLEKGASTRNLKFHLRRNLTDNC